MDKATWIEATGTVEVQSNVWQVDYSTSCRKSSIDTWYWAGKCSTDTWFWAGKCSTDTWYWAGCTDGTWYCAHSAVLIPGTVQVSAVLIPGTGQVSLSCTPPSCTAPQRVCCEYNLSTAHRASHAGSKGKYSHFCKQDEQMLRWLTFPLENKHKHITICVLHSSLTFKIYQDH